MPGILLAVHCKKGDPVNLKDAVLHYVATTYGDRVRTSVYHQPKHHKLRKTSDSILSMQAAQDCLDDLDEVESLRARVINQTSAGTGLRDILVKYFQILCAMESRFPISESRGHVDVSFSWYDAFRSSKKSEQSNIHFEKAAIAFNIAAAVSQYALNCDRKVAQGLIDSAKLFQEAAGIFSILRDSIALKVNIPRPVDVTPECTAMLEKLMLAQAQECVLEKAAVDGKATATLARLAKQVAIFYDETSRLLTSKPLVDHFDRSWQAHATVKSLLYHLDANLYNAADLRSKDDMKGVAREIAQLKASKSTLDNAKKEAKNASKELQDNVAAKERAISERLEKAEKENAAVYLQRVPPAADLPSVVPAVLVKAVVPPDLAGDRGAEGMFSGVVPESFTKSLSKYTDMVDTMIRHNVEKLTVASDEARLRLREWELPESLSAVNASSVHSLPDGVRMELEGVKSSGGYGHLQELATQIQNLRKVTSEELAAADAELKKEAAEDEELRQHYGAARWNRSQSSKLTAAMRDKIEGYRGNLAAAAASDSVLEATLAAEAGAFAVLDPERAAASMPRLEAPMLIVDSMEPAEAVAALRNGLDGMSTLSAQRAGLEEALKQRKALDDILPKLLQSSSASDDTDALFRSELSKYDELTGGVEENVAKQQHLLQAIDAANTKFRALYGFADWRKRCETAAQSVRDSIKSFKDIEGHLSEGVGFYTTLQDAVAALKKQIDEYCIQRKVQRDDMLEQLKRAAAQQEAAAAQQFAQMTMQGSGGAYGSGGMPPMPAQQQWPAGYGAAPPPPHLPPPPGVAMYPGYGPPAVPPPQQQQQQQYHQQYQPQQYMYGQATYGSAPMPPAAQTLPPPPPQQQQQQQSSGNPVSHFFGFGRQ